MDSDFIIKTRKLLGCHISKPELKETWLIRPPFKFIHDIILEVIQRHGYMSGLFSEEELIHENVKDKEKKIAFLKKVLDFTMYVTRKDIPVNPVKIVCGLEPENTNLLLQYIGEAISMKIDNDHYLRKFKRKSMKKKEKHDLQTGIVAIETSKSQSDVSNKKKMRVVKSEIVDVNSKLLAIKESDTEAKGRGDVAASKTISDGNQHETAEVKHPDANKESRGNNQLIKSINKEMKEEDAVITGVSKKAEDKLIIDGSTSDFQRLVEDCNAPLQAKVFSDDEKIVGEFQVKKSLVEMEVRQISLNEPHIAATDAEIVGPMIVLEGESTSPDGNQQIVDDNHSESNQDEYKALDDDLFQENVDEKAVVAGSLVGKMLKAKNRLQEKYKKELCATWRDEREKTDKEMCGLRSMVQEVTRGCARMVHLLDYAQEDVDAMLLEYTMWRRQQQINIDVINKEVQLTENILEPLVGKLGQLEIKIEEMQEQNVNLRRRIHGNHEMLVRRMHQVVKGHSF